MAGRRIIAHLLLVFAVGSAPATWAGPAPVGCGGIWVGAAECRFTWDGERPLNITSTVTGDEDGWVFTELHTQDPAVYYRSCDSEKEGGIPPVIHPQNFTFQLSPMKWCVKQLPVAGLSPNVQLVCSVYGTGTGTFRCSTKA